MFLLNNIKVNESEQRTIGDVQYPAGWFTDADERAKVGMIEVADPVRPDDSLFIVVENPDGSYTATPRTADEIAMYKENIDAVQAVVVRNSRGQKLANSDWTQVADSPVDKAVWATYRQALRDITIQEGFPWSVTWPDAP